MSNRKKSSNGVLSAIIIIVIIFVIGRIYNKSKAMFNKNKTQTTNQQGTTQLNKDSMVESTKGVYSELAVDASGIWPPGQKPDALLLEENLLKKNYYIVFDGSGSMEGDRLETAKTALKKFVTQIPLDANLGLAVFDYMGLTERSPFGESRDYLINEIDQVTANGITPLSSAVELAYKKIIEQGHKQLGYGEYNLVIVTDGEASDGYEPNKIVNLILQDSPVSIHTIGFQIGENHSLNQPGKIFYKSANNLEELTKGLEDVLAESEEFSVTSFE